MSISYRIDLDAGIVVVTVEGVVSDGDSEKHLAALLEDPEYSSEFAILGDARRVEEVRVTSAGIESLMKFTRDRQFQGRRLGLVATSDVVYGMARMYQIRREDSSYEVAVFREIEEARAWIVGRGADQHPMRSPPYPHY